MPEAAEAASIMEALVDDPLCWAIVDDENTVHLASKAERDEGLTRFRLLLPVQPAPSP